MGRRRLIDLDEDLLDADEAAAHLGLASADALHVYIRRFPGGPPQGLQPAISKRSRTRLWLRQDLDAFLKAHPRIGRKHTRDDEPDPS